MLTAVAMTGQGEALDDGRWYVAPTSVRIQGGGWTKERVPVDHTVAASRTSERGARNPFALLARGIVVIGSPLIAS